MNNDLYVLDDSGNPIRETDLMKWAQWFEQHDVRRVARETVGDSEISTVFLGIDHSFCETGPPVLWETMVFGGPMDQEQDRCSGSREQSEAMHRRMVDRVKQQAKRKETK